MLISSRTLYEQSRAPDASGAVSFSSGLTLHHVREKLLAIERSMKAEDVVRPLCDLSVSFVGGRMYGVWVDETRRLYFSQTAASQAAKEVLPSRFFAGLRDLAGINAQRASDVWSDFSTSEFKNAQVNRLVRTVQASVHGSVYKVIRSVHGLDYKPYSNLDFVEHLLAESDTLMFASLPVLQVVVTDDGFRLRFTALDAIQTFLTAVDDKYHVDSIPMVELWNSETGRRSVGIRPGVWYADSATGRGHFVPVLERTWAHRGAYERIVDELRDAFSETMRHAQEAVEEDRMAATVVVHDFSAFLEDELDDSVPVEVRAAAEVELYEKEQVTLRDIGRAFTKAGGALEIYDQYDLEKTISNLIKRGLKIADKHGGEIPC